MINELEGPLPEGWEYEDQRGTSPRATDEEREPIPEVPVLSSPPRPCCDDEDKPIVTHSTTINLDGEYEGWYAVMDSDPDTKTLLDLTGFAYPGKAPAAMDGTLASYQALNRVLVAWNFQDKWGVRVPATFQGVIRVPRSAISAISMAYLGEYTGSLPNQPGAATSPTSTTRPAQRTNGTGRRPRSKR